jgi:hypothetical protein
MKKTIILTLLPFIAFAGFFNEEGAARKAEQIENQRLCKIFTKKVEIYEKKIRNDLLAKVSLESYKYRRDIFCKEAK